MATTTEELIDAAKNTPTPTSTPPPPPQAFSYADAAQQKLPSIAAAKCFAQTRTIKISPPPNDPTASFKDLSEDILVEKANVTLELIRKTIPDDAEFLSARKTAQGHILYKANSIETADWLRTANGTKVFISKFGSNVSLAVKPFPILVEFIPNQFNTDEPSALRDIECKSLLPTGSIKSAR
ncbi:hypothetical protein SCLCIDRAFT_101882 [Scleroderma citrinum Foug A]|uniref:Uncharacterized protein n=1 Tax=Scleroderma citrinum Foug A TaxID=1036808 RepID=A0A0C3EAW0_9AGAM|nr:hypothetical protein SCLCIDRAFT_101882 [Scleroderma citrinum Foug A]